MLPCRPTGFTFAFLPARGTRFLCAFILLAAIRWAHAGSWTWTGNAGNANWSSTGNWNLGSAPASASTTDIVFSGTNNPGTALVPLNQNLANPFQLNSLSFAGGAGSFFLGGNALAFTGAASSITQTSANAQSIANNLTASSNSLVVLTLTGDGAGIVTLSGTINSGAGNRDYAITKTGNSTFVLSGVSNYGGATTISAGVLNIQNGSALGSTVTGTSVAFGAALQIQGGIAVGGEALTLNGSGIASDGAFRNISGNNSYAGTITQGSASTIASDTGTLTLTGGIVDGGFTTTFGGAGDIISNGVISGTGAVVKNGSGTLNLNASNTYSGGTTINGGTVIVIANGLGASTAPVTINAGTLQVSTTFTATRNFTLGDVTSAVRVDAAQTYTLNGVINGTGTLNKTGSGTLVLGGINTYSGGTNVNAGTLRLSGSGILGGTSGGLTVNAGTVDLNGTTQTVGALNGSGGTILNNNTGTARTLTVGTGGATGSYAGVIADHTVGTGTVSLTKTGAGTQTLSGANTYTGATVVSGGTLTLSAGAPGAINSTSSVTVNSSATLLLGGSNQINNTASITLAGGTFAKGNFSEGSTTATGLGALTLTASGSKIDFGTGSVGTVTFASFTPGSFSVTIDNWTGTANAVGSGSTDRLIFASSQNANLSSFSFAGYAPGAVEFDLGNGY
ncbi:MAG TPA: autotransporter-associated beta strand repeat-containing protein, partial [Chthoniobacterales bacterium]